MKRKQYTCCISPLNGKNSVVHNTSATYLRLKVSLQKFPMFCYESAPLLQMFPMERVKSSPHALKKFPMLPKFPFFVTKVPIPLALSLELSNSRKLYYKVSLQCISLIRQEYFVY